MIEVKDLTKRYGNHFALDNVTFTAKEGEIVGLLGHNGAGKTTTMRILTGFMPPTSGMAKVCGQDVITASLKVRQLVGYLPERMPIYPEMTVHGFVLFWARLRGVKHPKARADIVLKQFELLDRKHHLVNTLSKGLKQRLGMAQALVHEPKVVILDEPTIGIDPKQVIEVREIVKGLKEQHTVLFSSHILSEVEQVCDRVVILNKGKVTAQGTPGSLSKGVQASQRLFLDVGDTSLNALQKALEKLINANQITPHEGGFLVKLSRKDDARADVSRLLAKANIPLLEMRPLETSLEDTFLRLME